MSGGQLSPADQQRLAYARAKAAMAQKVRGEKHKKIYGRPN